MEAFSIIPFYLEYELTSNGYIFYNVTKDIIYTYINITDMVNNYLC